MKPDDVLEEILKKRGVEGAEEIEEFLSNKPKKTYDPFLLHNMAEGVDLLLDSFKKKKKICIYGDYDSDGISSICILYQVFSKLSSTEIIYYIPSRIDEGYGLNKSAISAIANKGVDLIVTVDCGSISPKEVEYGQSLGVEFIVTDHHNIYGEPVDCILINPKQEQCKYPFKGLAGCGVAFKLAQALVKKTNLDKKILRKVLCLVAIGTIGDVVPLIDENRTLVKYGMVGINSKTNIGLATLIEKSVTRTGIIDSETVAYSIVPHINAAGRMAMGDIGVKLFLSKSSMEAKGYVDLLIAYNNQRKQVQKETYQECLSLVEEQCGKSLFPIVEALGAHEGITGIVAGNLKETLGRPVAIVTPTEDGLKGSGRSTSSIDMFQILKKHESIFTRFGGHRGACGFLIDHDKLDTLRSLVHKEMEELIDKEPKILEVSSMVDLEIPSELLSLELFETLEQLEPFGSHNNKPLFAIKKAKISHIKTMGEGEIHGKFLASFKDGIKVVCVLFGKLQEFKTILMGSEDVKIIGKLSVNQWRERKELQILVEEIVLDN